MYENKSESAIEKGPRLGIRHIQIILLSWNIACIYMSRLSISVIVVAMTNAATTNPDFPEFDWTEKEKNYIQSSFYWGYLFLQFPAGFINRRFGAKTVLLASTFFSAISSLLTPYIVTVGGWQAYCAIRVMQGLAQGVIFPSVNDHLAKWSPKEERYLFGALTYASTNCGSVSAMLFSGLIASSSLGWPGISYISGGLCLAWCVIWLIFGSKNPPSSPYITKAECQYIQTSLSRDNDFHKKKIPIPWYAMLTSVAYVTLIIVFFADIWSDNTLQSQLPTYLNGVLHMNMNSNALYSSLPYIARWVMSYVFMFAGFWVVKKDWLGITALRKAANTLAMWTPAALLVVIGFLDDTNAALIIILFVVSVGCTAGTTIGCTLSVLDLSPNHASVLMGIANSLGSIVALITPLIAAFIVTDEHDRSKWQLLFGISAIVSFFGNLLFIILGSSEAQPWDAPDFLEKRKAEKAKEAAGVVLNREIESLEAVSAEVQSVTQ